MMEQGARIDLRARPPQVKKHHIGLEVLDSPPIKRIHPSITRATPSKLRIFLLRFLQNPLLGGEWDIESAFVPPADCAEESLYVSDPARSNPAARCFTRQRDVERVLKSVQESGGDGAMVQRRKEEEGAEQQGRLITLVSDCLPK